MQSQQLTEWLCALGQLKVLRGFQLVIGKADENYRWTTLLFCGTCNK